ncbi:MAG: NAD(P)/FAD-dependent oxidoreductase [Planctomycetota bacterium]
MEKPLEERATATWRVLGVELPVGESDAALRARVCRDLGLAPDELRGLRVVHKALDARTRAGERRLRFVIHADLVLDARVRGRAFSRARKSGRVVAVPPPATGLLPNVHASFARTPARQIAVIGAGPAGIFAAWVLARHGVRVLLVDRGAPVERRSRDVVAFQRTRQPNPESNLLFGEGGAGTFSDGKLYTRVADALEVPILEELVRCGAPAEITFDSRAHIGTDKLHRILPRLRARLEELGTQFHWNTRLERLVLSDDRKRVRALDTTCGEIPCDGVVLAPGHSARDTWARLFEQGVAVESKPFQLGVRVEHPQELVTTGRHGTSVAAQTLGPASYQLVCRAEDGLLAAHTFCMCPGGRIVASVSEHGFLCTNGMSNSKHSSRYANAAVVVTLGPNDFGAGPFDGVQFQRELEARFFDAGGSDYTAPAQRVPDFLARRASSGELTSSYRFGARAGRIDELLPARVHASIARALLRFDRSIPGFAGASGLIVGIESRSSGPVRLPRDAETLRARGFENLWPVGEGAGYAGGIMSAALDGARAALAVLAVGVPPA